MLCEYCGVGLEVGVNWTDHRRDKKIYTCRGCASKIAQGKMSRSDRIMKNEGEPLGLGVDVTRHNVEMLGKDRASAREALRKRIEAQFTPEIKLALESEPHITRITLQQKS